MAASRLAYREVADRLREQILDGQFHAGERLPSEAELCGLYGVSRSTVREALRMLSSQRLVKTSRGVGGGSQVARLEPGDVMELLHDGICMLARSDQATVAELLEARDLLEIPAARLAALRGTPEQLERLRETIPATTGDIEHDRIFEVNRGFHEVLLEMAGNRLIQVVTEPLFSVMQVRYLRDMAGPVYWEDVLADHQTILGAVAAGDGGGAARAMADHLAHMRLTYETLDSDGVGQTAPAPPPVCWGEVPVKR
jgi:DNA-binding FadR family transcriptional regulator